uniref:Exonuclease domain-containing protein n=1 Tax=Meloidogyne javanica TaxID=6303 RepID=A0A915MYE0_MELJA
MATTDNNKIINNMPPSLNEQRLIWIDCEMTGLDPIKDKLVEIACIVTEGDLKIVAEFGPFAIKQPTNILEGMNDFLMEFLLLHTPPKTCQLAGNSVHYDLQFLKRYMPKFVEHLHYRIIDVSTIKELVKRWYSDSEKLSCLEKALTSPSNPQLQKAINVRHALPASRVF